MEKSVSAVKVETVAQITSEQFQGKDEWYCNWYCCPSCGVCDIAKGFNYCPNCGATLEWKLKEETR